MNSIESGYSVTPHTPVPIGKRHLEGPLLRLDLAGELVALRLSEGFRARGHSAKTLAKYPDLRVLLLAFAEGAKLAEHRTKGRLSIQVLNGQAMFEIGHETTVLTAGGFLMIAPYITHDLTALADSAVLLTIAWSQSTDGSIEGAPNASGS